MFDWAKLTDTGRCHPTYQNYGFNVLVHTPEVALTIYVDG